MLNIISKYERTFSKIQRLEHIHHNARVEDILEPCHGDLPSDKMYTEPIRRLASKALKLLFKLISLENPDSTYLPNNSHKHWSLKEIGLKEVIDSNAEYIELGEVFFIFEPISEGSSTHMLNTMETFIWDSMDLLSKYNIKLETLAKKIHNYCPIPVEGCKRQMSLSSFCDPEKMRDLLYCYPSKTRNYNQPISLENENQCQSPISSLKRGNPDSSPPKLPSSISPPNSPLPNSHNHLDLIHTFLRTQLASMENLKIPHFFSSFLPPQTNTIVCLSVQPRSQRNTITKKDKTAPISPDPNPPIHLPPSIKPPPNLHIISFPISIILLILKLVFKKQTSESHFFYFLLLSLNLVICLSVQVRNCTILGGKEDCHTFGDMIFSGTCLDVPSLIEKY